MPICLKGQLASIHEWPRRVLIVNPYPPVALSEILRPDLLRCLGSGAQGGVVTEPIVSAPDLLRLPRWAILIPLRLTLTSTNTLSCVSLLLDSLDDVEWKNNRAGHVYVSTAKAYTFGRGIEGPEGVRMITCRVDMKLGSREAVGTFSESSDSP